MIPFRYRYILNPDDKLVQWFVNGGGSVFVLNMKWIVWRYVIRHGLLMKWGILLCPHRFIQAFRTHKK